MTIVRGPHAGSTRRLEVRRLEHFGPTKQGMIQSVRLAVTRVAKYRHHFDWRFRLTAQASYELTLVGHLQAEIRKCNEYSQTH